MHLLMCSCLEKVRRTVILTPDYSMLLKTVFLLMHLQLQQCFLAFSFNFYSEESSGGFLRGSYPSSDALADA